MKTVIKILLIAFLGMLISSPFAWLMGSFESEYFLPGMFIGCLIGSIIGHVWVHKKNF
jgi:H+/Cl- antiporter ClcA